MTHRGHDDELDTGRARPLRRIYPVVLTDASYVKIREGQVGNQPLYVALRVNPAGDRDVVC